ncbi:MAG: MBL fold metallo-hydrolase, partial [Firmicutes bacterium]|nr:MBL fold metallo-hydrolase [Bacillota bacterium]
MNITKDIIYIGVNDHDVDLFEGQYIVPDGMAYNSYLVKGEKTAVMDTVDKHFRDQWLENLDKALEGAEPDYLIVQHMEPDHSANIAAFMEKYPKAVVCASKQAFNMMKNFFGTDFAGRNMTVGEGSVLDLGGHVLRFVAAPMVHWPEVVMTYDETEKV